MTLEEAIKINAKIAELVEKKAYLQQILIAANNPLMDVKTYLPQAVLEAYNRDEIGHVYFEFIQNIKDALKEVQEEINSLPRINMGLALSLI